MRKTYFDYVDGVQIMIMRDPSDDEWEVYYRIAGWQFIYGFGISTRTNSLLSAKILARQNAEQYAEVLFQ